MREHNAARITQRVVGEVELAVPIVRVTEANEMRRNEHRERTFGAILNQVEAENCERMMQRARLANRVAKVVVGSPRLKAYRIKHKALTEMVSRFPDRGYVRPDPQLAEFVIVTSLVTPWGLHAPSEVFGGDRPEDLADWS